ncbi:hypothetical protein WICPIJ_001821 [Wickerhamomyces pijperi]|uniref:Uncharacterized protein n=1 Tax=Wickerhamomyces pijperi TaxID=599730 RepID=A0A9P8QAZ3_WICPI|nr:hypothetical protein WICPIJ_001821 [Wickerhamomyces pijperi]
MEEITNNVQGLSIDKSKKKRRAFHNLNQSPYQQQQPQFPASQEFPPNHAPQFAQYQNPSPAGTPQLPQNGLAPVIGQTFTPQTQAQPSSHLQEPLHQNALANGDILSVPSTRLAQQREYYSKQFFTLQNTVPPTSTTRFQAVDQGVSPPAFKRVSLYNAPTSESLREKTGLPFGLTIRPFAPTDEPVPVVDFTNSIESGPIRCQRCRAFVNPHFVFDHAQKFKCNMCKFPNNRVPYDYNAPIDPQTNTRADKYLRPELHRGVYDILVPSEYNVGGKQENSAMHLVYLLDITAGAGVLNTVIDAVKESLDYLQPETKIAIITFDSKLQFYNLNKTRTEVHVVSDLEDPFIPFANVFTDHREFASNVHECLTQIADTNTKRAQSIELCYGSALRVAGMLLKDVGGGKIITTLSKIPNSEPGKLVFNENAVGCEVFQGTNKYYSDLSLDFVKCHISVDLFVFNSQSVDLNNASYPVLKTNGILKNYTNFIQERDYAKFRNDFVSSLLAIRGYQGELKTRVSSGLSVTSYYGNITDQQSPKFPVVSSEQEISVLLSYDQVLNKKEDVHFQTSVLYTDMQGTRKVRVINLVVSTTEQVSDVFAFADQDVVLNIIIRNCLTFISKQSPQEIKASTTKKLVDIYKKYRLNVSTSSPNELVIPNSLNLLLACILSFQKTKVFKAIGSKDVKIFEYYLLNSLPLEKLLYKLYPVAFPLHNLHEDECMFNDKGQFVMVQESLRLSSQFVVNGGVYLFFNGTELILYVTPNVNPNLLQDLFNVQTVEEVTPALRPLDTHVSQQVQNIIKFFTDYLHLTERINIKLIRKNIEHDADIQDLLVEDRSMDKTESYLEFVQSIHKTIKLEMEGKKENPGSTESSNFFNLDNTSSVTSDHYVHY